MPRWRFSAVLIRPEGRGTWTLAPLKIGNAKKAGIVPRMKVKGSIDGSPFKGSILPGGRGSHFVVVR
ncbi:MAG: DUF1905 domain-containing protein [Thaumarchaeota archaeon]|nr:DUF1905 domain-containing protein [Nitrososphaerota archaeon]